MADDDSFDDDCPACGGTGWKNPNKDDYTECPKCGGSGRKG